MVASSVEVGVEGSRLVIINPVRGAAVVVVCVDMMVVHVESCGGKNTVATRLTDRHSPVRREERDGQHIGVETKPCW